MGFSGLGTTWALGTAGTPWPWRAFPTSLILGFCDKQLGQKGFPALGGLTMRKEISQSTLTFIVMKKYPCAKILICLCKQKKVYDVSAFPKNRVGKKLTSENS